MFVILILPSLLLGSCSKDDHDVVLVSGKSKSWLGVQVTGLSEKMLKNMDLDYGIKVIKVLKDSPAEKAGLEEDDIIVKFDGQKINDPGQLVDLVRETKIGEQAEVTFVRNGIEKTIEVEIAERQKSHRIRIFKHPGKMWFEGTKSAWLGVETTSLNEQLRTYFNAPEGLGVMIKKVVEKSPAEEGGILAGDVIIGVEDRKIRSTRDLTRSIQYYDPGEVVEVKFIRDKNEKSLRIKLGEKKHGPNFHFYGDLPEDFVLPELDVEIPEIDFDQDIHIEIDEQKLEELEQRIEQEVKVKSIELKQKMDALQKEMEQKLQKILIRQV